jgi:hypothetical protein
VEINGKRNIFYRAEIVVALEHARTVSGRLANLDIPVLERHRARRSGWACSSSTRTD